jgi:prepilin-type N-terminal cleavage/methylation domain-containing protein
MSGRRGQLAACTTAGGHSPPARREQSTIRNPQFAMPSLATHHSPLITHHSPLTTRSAFTLVELLVTMIIISILAAITLGALQKAHQAADVAKTRSMIARLHNQIMIRWESYRTRRVPIVTSGAGPQAAAALRLAGIRELMRFELPERYSDIVDAPVVLAGLRKPTSSEVPPWMTPAPTHGGVSAVSSAFLRRYMRNTDPISGQPAKPSEKYEGAECLYMIITMNTEDDFAGAEQFKSKDIGDADGDGMPEFHDAWGQPIEFLRWAPGFVSDLQPSTDGSDGSKFSGSDFNLHPRQPNTHHDPMDPLKLQKEAFALFPLIYSGGIDRQTDIARQPYDTSTSPPTPDPNWRSKAKNNDPYASLHLSSPWEYAVGAPGDIDGDGDEGSADNIHNHLIGLR